MDLSTIIDQNGQQEKFTFTEENTIVEMKRKYYLQYIEHQDGQETPMQIKSEDKLIH